MYARAVARTEGMAVALRDELSAQLALVSALVDCAFTASLPPQLWRDLHRLAGASLTWRSAGELRGS